MITTTNGKPKTEKRVYKSLKELELGLQNGDLHVPDAPPIHEVAIPQVQEIAIPTVDIQVNTGPAFLKKAAERIRARKALEKRSQAEQALIEAEQERARNEQLQRRSEALNQQKEYNKKVGDWMGYALRSIHEIQTVVESEDVGEEILSLDASEDYPRTDGKKLTYGEQMKEWREKINGFQTHKNPLIRLPLIVIEAEFWLSITSPDQDELVGRLEELVENEVLKHDPRGSICGPRGVRFCLAKRFDELDPNYKLELALKIKTAVENQVRRIKKEFAENIRQEANLTFDQFMEGKQGKFLLTIPPQPHSMGVYPGGTLLVEIDGKDILPIIALGSIGNQVAVMADIGIRLPHKTLGWDNVPNSRQIKENTIKPNSVPENLENEYTNRSRTLWYMITRGIKAK